LSATGRRRRQSPCSPARRPPASRCRSASGCTSSGTGVIGTTEKRDYYEALGISRDADAKAVKEAFRTLALKYHPDRNREPGAEERFKEIAEAYAVLSDPKKRADYDAGGFAGVAGVSPEDLFGGVDFDSIFGGMGLGFRGGLFDRFSRRAPEGPAHGDDIEILATIPLERIATGGQHPIRFQRMVPCPECHGSGAKAGTQPRPCPVCKGSGQKVSTRRERGVLFRQSVTCPDCRGQGSFVDAPCPGCGGRGIVPSDEALAVTIPAGAEDGLVLRISGKGHPSGEPGGIPGNLLVVVRTAPDARFVREGADLWHREPVDIVDAVLGTERPVPALDGALTVKIPAGVQPDAQLRLRGKGLPRFGTSGRGDLYVQVAIAVPQRLSAEERKLWERLRLVRSKRGAGEP
jgi:molecular chaperone DnaJ